MSSNNVAKETRCSYHWVSVALFIYAVCEIILGAIAIPFRKNQLAALFRCDEEFFTDVQFVAGFIDRVFRAGFALYLSRYGGDDAVGRGGGGGGGGGGRIDPTFGADQSKGNKGSDANATEGGIGKGAVKGHPFERATTDVEA